jgi:hypothetical protein
MASTKAFVAYLYRFAWLKWAMICLLTTCGGVTILVRN